MDINDPRAWRTRSLDGGVLTLAEAGIAPADTERLGLAKPGTILAGLTAGAGHDLDHPALDATAARPADEFK